MSTAAPESPPAVPAASSRAVLAWVLGSLFFFYAFVHRVAPSVMVEELMRDFAVGAAILGNLSAFYFYAYAGLQIPVGVLMDKVGPRRLMTAALGFTAAGALVFASSTAVEGAYLGRLLVGAGTAFSWVGTLTVIALWLPASRFALCSGVSQMAGVLGAVTGQASLGYAMEVTNWRDAMTVVGLLGFLLAALMWVTVRDRPHPRGAGRGLMAGLRRVAANRQTWLTALFGLAMTGPMLAFAGLWAVPWAGVAYGLSRTEAAAVVSLLFFGWAAGAPTFGWLSDRVGRRRPLMIVGGSLALASLSLALYVPGLPLAWLPPLFLAHGFGAASMVLAFACAREHNPPWATGATLGIVNTFVTGSGALLQPAIGIVLDLNWDGTLVDGARVYDLGAYRSAFLLLPGGCLLGTLAALCLRETWCRPQVTE